MCDVSITKRPFLVIYVTSHIPVGGNLQSIVLKNPNGCLWPRTLTATREKTEYLSCIAVHPISFVVYARLKESEGSHAIVRFADLNPTGGSLIPAKHSCLRPFISACYKSATPCKGLRLSYRWCVLAGRQRVIVTRCVHWKLCLREENASYYVSEGSK